MPSPYDGYSPQKRWRRQERLGRQWAGVPVETVRDRSKAPAIPPSASTWFPAWSRTRSRPQAPDRIALLRLDTDWYASTKHELEHLYPRLAEGGVLIIDDTTATTRAPVAPSTSTFAERDEAVLLNRSTSPAASWSSPPGDGMTGAEPRRWPGLVSVTAPAHNEAEVLEPFYERVRDALEGFEFELVIVDDGSTDGSAEVLDRLAAADDRVRVVHLSRSFGYQAAVAAGSITSRATPW